MNEIYDEIYYRDFKDGVLYIDRWTRHFKYDGKTITHTDGRPMFGEFTNAEQKYIDEVYKENIKK